MAWVALNCPQCSAPLPRVAIWRAVKCESCGALITKTESIVMRDTFRQALKRARQASATGQIIRCGGQSFHLMQVLGKGEISQVHLAERVGAMPFLATIKLSSASHAATRFAREAEVLRELQQASDSPASSYFTQRLPEVAAQGLVEGSQSQQALVLRYPNGYWGSLADLNAHFAQGIDPRHAVWIWRRILEVLGFVHTQGWAHGDVRPEHALVHPRDHGVRLIGWASAQKWSGPKAQATDLLHSARIIQVLLCGASDAGGTPHKAPEELAQLVTQASQDIEFCSLQKAGGLDALLRAAAETAFGSPKFVPLTI